MAISLIANMPRPDRECGVRWTGYRELLQRSSHCSPIAAVSLSAVLRVSAEHVTNARIAQRASVVEVETNSRLGSAPCLDIMLSHMQMTFIEMMGLSEARRDLLWPWPAIIRGPNSPTTCTNRDHSKQACTGPRSENLGYLWAYAVPLPAIYCREQSMRLSVQIHVV